MDRGYLFTTSVTVRIIYADPEKLINTLIKNRVIITEIEYVDELTVHIKIPARCFFCLKSVAEHSGAKIYVQNVTTFKRFIEIVFMRPVLLAGSILLILLSVYISGKILFVRVIGNQSISSYKIIEQAESTGLYFGADKSELSNAHIKNKLLESIPKLQWIGVNIQGCIATIEVKERTDIHEANTPIEPACIVASKDGVIYSVSATKGTIVCKPGQAVSEGEILISANEEIGDITVISGAEGEIMADTINKIRLVALGNRLIRTENAKVVRRFSIIFGKKLINLYKGSGILDTTCVKIYMQKDIYLPGQFPLPLSICCEEIYSSSSIEDKQTTTDWLTESGVSYIQTRLVSGIVVDTQHIEGIKDELLYCELTMYCREMIGKIKKEEIFIFNGEDY